jgi:hypothetical protein
VILVGHQALVRVQSLELNIGCGSGTEDDGFKGEIPF